MGHEPIPSRAALPGGHPIHPILIPFPIAFLVGALLTDAMSFASDAAFWPEASRWLIGAGIVSGVAAAIPGLVDYIGSKRVRSHRSAMVHGVGNALVILVAAVNLGGRIGSPAEFIDPVGVILSAATAALLGVTGYIGGELAYRHRIGAIPDADERRRIEAEQGTHRHAA